MHAFCQPSLMIPICRIIFLAFFVGIVRGTTTTTQYPVNGEMFPFDNAEAEYQEWQREYAIRNRHYNLRRHYGGNDDNDPIRLRQRRRAQFLLLFALVQVWLAFMRLINRNRE